MHFVSTTIVRETRVADLYRIVGDLTANGITKPIALMAKREGARSFPKPPYRPYFTITGEAEIDRRQFGATEPTTIRGNMIGIRIEADGIDPAPPVVPVDRHARHH